MSETWYLVDSHLDQKQVSFDLAHAVWKVERSCCSTVVVIQNTKIFLRRTNLQRKKVTSGVSNMQVQRFQIPIHIHIG